MTMWLGPVDEIPRNSESVFHTICCTVKINMRYEVCTLWSHKGCRCLHYTQKKKRLRRFIGSMCVVTMWLLKVVQNQLVFFIILTETKCIIVTINSMLEFFWDSEIFTRLKVEPVAEELCKLFLILLVPTRFGLFFLFKGKIPSHPHITVCC